MNIVNSPGVSTPITATPGSAAESAQVSVLKKALNQQAASAATLLDALPQPAQLATSGTLGRNVDEFA